jgi:hypothetical protein
LTPPSSEGVAAQQSATFAIVSPAAVSNRFTRAILVIVISAGAFAIIACLRF